MQKTYLYLLIFLLSVVPLFIAGCSSVPFMGNDEDELAFEEDFPIDDWANEEKSFFTDKSENFFNEDQYADKQELQEEVGDLQTRQENLITEVSELEQSLLMMDLEVEIAQERLDNSLSIESQPFEFLKPEVEELKTQIALLKDEINFIKSQRMGNAVRNKSRVRTPPGYNRALAAYRSGNYGESIFMFQDLGKSNPSGKLKDNIEFWLGMNYFKLDMYDDAIRQFETVISIYPRGNKVHDSRYMLGRVYYRIGRVKRAENVLEAALKLNPPAEVKKKIRRQLEENS